MKLPPTIAVPDLLRQVTDAITTMAQVRAALIRDADRLPEALTHL